MCANYPLNTSKVIMPSACMSLCQNPSSNLIGNMPKPVQKWTGKTYTVHH